MSAKKTWPLLAALILTAACGEATVPVYQATADSLYLGSLHYARQGCANCHGSDWDGKGPEAGVLTRENLTPSNFTATTGRTTVDYFKTITMGTERMPQHAHQQLTDRARWDLAHFLMSLGGKFTGKETKERMQRRKSQLQEVEQAYARATAKGYRRWELGFRSAGEREPKPTLDRLLDGATAPLDEYPTGVVSREQKERSMAVKNDTPTNNLYQNNCAGCHGVYGEGRATGERFGLIDCPKRDRKCGVYISTRDFRSTDLSSFEAFEQAHKTNLQTIAPSFQQFTAEDWRALHSHVRSLIEE